MPDTYYLLVTKLIPVTGPDFSKAVIPATTPAIILVFQLMIPVVILVGCRCFIKFRAGQDAGMDSGIKHMLNLVTHLLSSLLLLPVQIKNGTGVLFAMITELTVFHRGINMSKKENQQLLITDLSGIIGYPHRFLVRCIAAGDFMIVRIFACASVKP